MNGLFFLALVILAVAGGDRRLFVSGRFFLRDYLL